jgi:hypothetical protein
MAMVLLRGTEAQFIDFQCLLHAILPMAVAAGWREDDVRAALEAVVVDLRLKCQPAGQSRLP